jgi:uncharacterized Fe-S cluster-containing MiaB family protein
LFPGLEGAIYMNEMPFEQGPIRPPSEAQSLLLRLTRNCPWNRCVFCPVYKKKKFSKRSEQDILDDIDEAAEGVHRAKELSWQAGLAGEITRTIAARLLGDPETTAATAAAAVWLLHGKGSVFLQDSDALVLPNDVVVRILRHLKEKLPGITRVTCYSRSATLSRKSVEALTNIREAGLDRVHVGLESGSRAVLELVRKGATPEMHVKGGRNVLEAGLELSEYVMPGLGGTDLSREHAVESARVIAEISPHFTRLRSLGVRRDTPLEEMISRGEFAVPDDDSIMREIRLMVERLEGARTTIVSDHILNLMGDLEGTLPGDAGRLLGTIDAYLDLPARERSIYRLGRRAGIFDSTKDLDSPAMYAAAERLYREVAGARESVDEVCRELLGRMI